MRKWIILLFCINLVASIMAQQKNVSYKFSGFIRDDLFLNSRKNVEGVDGLFHLYPLNESLDAKGKDLNAVPNSSLSSITARLWLDVAGPDVGTAKLAGKIEADFTGTAATPYLLYLRQAFLSLTWEGGSQLLVGQTWHPLFGEVVPDVLDLTTGAPFNPFNRSPMLRYRYTTKGLSLTAAAVYQTTSLSAGPNGKSEEYLKNGLVPELFAGINYQSKGFLGGVGAELLSLKPRTQAAVNGQPEKVDERLTTASFVAQAQYKSGAFFIAAKSFLAQNLGHTTLLGGYGLASINGQQTYTAQRHSTSWLDITYGAKWRGGLFLGYSKNLGTDKPLASNVFYGNGFDIDQLANGSLSFSYNLPHWKAGIEYSATTAWYGDVDLRNGKVSNTTPITGHRILGILMYMF